MKLKLKIFITVVLVIILGCLVYAVNLYFPIKQAQEIPVLMYHNVVDKTTFNDKYRGKQSDAHKFAPASSGCGGYHQINFDREEDVPSPIH